MVGTPDWECKLPASNPALTAAWLCQTHPSVIHLPEFQFLDRSCTVNSQLVRFPSVDVLYVMFVSVCQCKRSAVDKRSPPSPLWSGFDSRTRRLVWVEFVVGSRRAPRGFSGITGFPPSTKTNTKFQFDLNEGCGTVSVHTYHYAMII